MKPSPELQAEFDRIMRQVELSLDVRIFELHAREVLIVLVPPARRAMQRAFWELRDAGDEILLHTGAQARDFASSMLPPELLLC